MFKEIEEGKTHHYEDDCIPPHVKSARNMTDKKFQDLLIQVNKELHKRMGRKMCKELHADCIDCKTRYLIGLNNSWIDLLEPWENSKKK